MEFREGERGQPKLGSRVALAGALLVALWVFVIPGYDPHFVLLQLLGASTFAAAIVGGICTLIVIWVLVLQIKLRELSPLLPVFVYALTCLAAFCLDWSPSGPARLALGMTVMLCAGMACALALRPFESMAIPCIRMLIAIQAVGAILILVSGNETFRSAWLTRASGTFHDPGELAFCCLIGVSLAESTATVSSLLNRIVGFGISSLSVIALILTWSRIGLAVGALLLMCRVRSLHSRRFGIIVAIFLVVLMLLSVRYLNPQITASTARSTGGRQSAVQTGIKNAKEAWPWGVGPGGIRIANPNERGGPMLLDTKNLYLNVIVELGVLGLAFFAWFGVVSFRLARVPGIWADPVFVCLITIFFVGLTEVPVATYARPAGNFLLGYLSVLCIGRWKWLEWPHVNHRLSSGLKGG